ncbi:MAG: peptidylprolyl isomerase [Flavobacteriaceae bacterium]
MALLGKIREKSIFLIIVIGLALFAFVISGALGTGNSDSNSNEPIGTVNGKEIPLDNFRFMVEQTERNFGLTTMQAVDNVWKQYIRNFVFEDQFKILGIDAGRDQIEQVVSSTESIINDERFTNEAGFFDFGLFTDFIVQMKNTNPEAYESWKQQELSIISSAKENIYFDLVKSSVSVTSKDAEIYHHIENDNIDIEYVKYPYSQISDTIFKLSDQDIKNYIDKNQDKYIRNESRSIEYVSFFENATEIDIKDIRESLTNLTEDKFEYNDVSKLTDTIIGFYNTRYLNDFINRHSDEEFDSIYLTKGKLPSDYAEILFNLKIGESFGPYKDINSFKISKLIDKKKNGSIRASHILISHNESNRKPPNVDRNKGEAKKIANTLFRQILRNKSKFESLAEEFSDGPSKSLGGDLGFFTENQIEPAFFNFAKKNRIGKIGLVETSFGFHIIKIVDKEDLVLFASLTKKIVPSEKTSNEVFKNATQFEMNSLNDNFQNAARESDYNVRFVPNVNKLDENLPGLPSQRRVIQWIFDDSREVGEIKRFDLSFGGYVVVKLKNINDKTVSDIDEVRDEITRELLNKKKANLIIKNNSTLITLEEFAGKNKLEIVTANAINQKSGTIVGSGEEQFIVGKAFGLEELETSELLIGNRGVYKLKITKKSIAEDLPDYSKLALKLESEERKNLPSLIISALENVAEIKDNRSIFY